MLSTRHIGPALGLVLCLFWTNSAPAQFVDAALPPIDDDRSSRTVGWVDVDGDGLLDLYISNNSGESLVCLNDGDETWTDITSGALYYNVSTHGGVWGDYDDDGDLDLFVFNNGSADIMVRNDGDGVFTDVTQPDMASTGNTHCGVWGDYDEDGDLDLYVNRFDGPNKLWRNDDSLFVDVTVPPLDDGDHNASVVWVDYDNDGDLDLYTVCENDPNKLFRNDDGVFVQATPALLDNGGKAFGAVWADYDNDGDLDFYLTNLGNANLLFRNEGGGVFSDVTPEIMADTAKSFGASWGDYDNDGDLDLYVSNRFEPNRLFQNDGAGGFVDVADVVLADADSGWGCAFGDYDQDGDLDLYIAVHNTNNRLFRNELNNGNHWLHVDLRGEESNSMGIGARILCKTGTLTQMREIHAGSGAGSQESITAEFGLGAVTVVDSLVIQWPMGQIQILTEVSADQRLVVEEPAGQATPAPAVGPGTMIMGVYPNPSHGQSQIALRLDREGTVTVEIFDLAGRRVRSLEQAVLPAGRHVLPFDGRDNRGRSLASGTYFARVRSGGVEASVRIAIVR